MKHALTYILGIAIVISLRFLPHPPNVEPIMASTLPFAKQYGVVWGAAFSFFAILGYDLASGTIGSWTWMTALTYAGVTGIGGWYLARYQAQSVKHYVLYAIAGTIIYDVITGVVFGVLLYNMGLWETVVGQIPFTFSHLAGNIVLSATISPVIYKYVILRNSPFVYIRTFPKKKA